MDVTRVTYLLPMRRISRGLQLLLALALVLALVGATGWLAYTTITKAPAVVAAVITGVLAILGLGIQRYFEQQREDERIRRERMAPIYEQLVKQFHLIAGEEVDMSDVERFFRDLAQSLQLWGSPYEELLLVTRADLGVSNESLETGDLMRIIVNDLDEHLETAASAT